MSEKSDLYSTQDRVNVIGQLQKTAPDFVDMISSFCIDKVYKESELPELTKETVAIVSLISLGSDRLIGHFESALESGASAQDLVEIVKLSAIYLGFPRAIDAMLKLHELLESRPSS